MIQLIKTEKFTNIQNAQAGLTRLFQNAEKTNSFYRVLKNDQSLGVLLPNKVWLSLLEDLEAMSSRNFRTRVAKARQDKTTYSASEVKKE
jgi:hypothetical protein